MVIVEDLQKAMNIMQNPGKATMKGMKPADAFAYYYKLTIVPLILYILIAVAFTAVFGNAFGQAFNYAVTRITSIVSPTSVQLLPTNTQLASAIASAFGVYADVAYPIIFLWVLLPIAIVIFSVFYQGVGAFFGTASKKFDATLAAVIYGVSPLVLFYWLLTIAFVGPSIYAIVLIWGLVVMIAALANQHRTTRLRAFVTMVLSTLFLLIAISIVVGLIVSLALLAIV